MPSSVSSHRLAVFSDGTCAERHGKSGWHCVRALLSTAFLLGLILLVSACGSSNATMAACANSGWDGSVGGTSKSCNVIERSLLTPLKPIAVSWASPAASSKVTGVTQFVLRGTELTTVEVFSGATIIAHALVSSDGVTAVASVDTRMLPNGAVTLTARAKGGATNTKVGSAAEAGSLLVLVANETVPMVGVYVGNAPADVARFEMWFGRAVDLVVGFTGHANWSDYDGSIGWAIHNWTAIDRRILWSIPLFAKGGSLDDAESGVYDGHYAKAAKQLVKYKQNEGRVYVRPGWEFNGDWFPWSAIGKPQKYVNAFRRFVEAFRAVAVANGTPNLFVFEWNVSIGDNGMNPELAYPGDEFVDIIGMDVYWFAKPRFSETKRKWEQWDPVDPLHAWHKQLNRPWGLRWLTKFAASHNKMVAISEWGIESESAGPYIDQMANWINSNSIIYHAYWDASAGYPGLLSDGSRPLAGQAYLNAFR